MRASRMLMLWAVRDDVRPVIEELVVMPLQLLAARFHLDEDSLRPHEIGEVLALGPALFREARLARGTGLMDAIVAEGAEEMVEEIGGLALLIALQVGVDVGDEGLEGFGKVCHAADDRRTGGCGKEKGGVMPYAQPPVPWLDPSVILGRARRFMRNSQSSSKALTKTQRRIPTGRTTIPWRHLITPPARRLRAAQINCQAYNQF
jgi:hypothetical protein